MSVASIYLLRFFSYGILIVVCTVETFVLSLFYILIHMYLGVMH